MKNWKQAEDNELVCYCLNVDKGTIVSAINGGNTTLKQILLQVMQSQFHRL